MANPQKENGYTAISNELLEALAGIRIAGEARQCLDVIFRKTYGFNKKIDSISLSQFCLMTKLTKPAVCRAILKLEQMNIIIIKKDNGIFTKYQVNKDFSTWTPLSKKITLSKKIKSVIKKDNFHYQKSDTQKKVSKESIKRNARTRENEKNKTQDDLMSVDEVNAKIDAYLNS